MLFKGEVLGGSLYADEIFRRYLLTAKFLVGNINKYLYIENFYRESFSVNIIVLQNFYLYKFPLRSCKVAVVSDPMLVYYRTQAYTLICVICYSNGKPLRIIIA